jgi:hypothetical protein
LLPALKLLHKKVISLGDLSKLGVHATLKVNKILPCFKGIPRILISLPHYFVKMTHGNLCHEGLLYAPAKYGFYTCISSL